MGHLETGDTIAAIATALSEAALGIIRITGPEAVAVGDAVFCSKGGRRRLKDFPTHTIHYGFLENDGETIDEVMVSILKGPHSYTGEDTVEFTCHGGAVVLQRSLETILRHGARLAQPGEFTKRAFLNGRIDLSQAEAVMEMIGAKNELARKASLGQLQGTVYTAVTSIREKLLTECARIEASMDDPEHISLDGYSSHLKDVTEDITVQLRGLLRNAQRGIFLKEDIETVLLGKANVGKSSLLNLLCGRDSAIVTDVPGTTRDALRERVQLGQISLSLVDTAGIRETEDVIEHIGMERTARLSQNASLILFVLDKSRPLDEDDGHIAELIGDRACIALLNKSDLPAYLTADMVRSRFGKEWPVVETSAKTGDGIETLEKEMEALFAPGGPADNQEAVITRLRQKEEVEAALLSVERVQDSIEKGLPEDFYTIDLMDAYSALGRIIGEGVDEDLIEEIFSHFCMGK